MSNRGWIESGSGPAGGAAFSATAVIDLGGMMILGMAFPNIIGLVMFWKLIRRDLDGDWARYRRGEFERVK